MSVLRCVSITLCLNYIVSPCLQHTVSPLHCVCTTPCYRVCGTRCHYALHCLALCTCVGVTRGPRVLGVTLRITQPSCWGPAVQVTQSGDPQHCRSPRGSGMAVLHRVSVTPCHYYTLSTCLCYTVTVSLYHIVSMCQYYTVSTVHHVTPHLGFACP